VCRACSEHLAQALTAGMTAGAYVSNFSSGGRIHEDNGGLPLPDAYQVRPTMLYSYAVLLPTSTRAQLPGEVVDVHMPMRRCALCLTCGCICYLQVPVDPYQAGNTDVPNQYGQYGSGLQGGKRLDTSSLTPHALSLLKGVVKSSTDAIRLMQPCIG
jgi:hypothetical protein